jgi:hypothetical protein
MALDVLGLSGFVGGRTIPHMGLPKIPWASPAQYPYPELVMGNRFSASDRSDKRASRLLAISYDKPASRDESFD